MSIVSVTVAFPCPIAGSDIIDAVRRISSCGDTWYKELQDGGRYTIGRASYFPYRQLIVVSGSETPGFRPVDSYSSIDVRDFAWPGVNPFGGSCDDDAMIRNITSFAQQLERHFVNVIA